MWIGGLSVRHWVNMESQPFTTGSDLLDQHEVSEILRIPVGTLAQWRSRKKGPPWAKLGGRVRYDAALLDAWIAENTTFPRAT